MQYVNVLIIDDHPIIAEGYTNALQAFSLNNTNYKLNVDSAYSIDTAIKKVNNLNTIDSFNLVLLDISMPSSKAHNMFSGEELGIYIKERLPKAKLMVLTALNDDFRLINIFTKLSPKGFIVKSDLTFKLLLNAVKILISGNTYYSETINTLLRNKAKQNIVIDAISKNILRELANGSKMKELKQFIPLTKSGIDRRKRLLKKAFNAQTDRDLVIIAREKGYL